MTDANGIRYVNESVNAWSLPLDMRSAQEMFALLLETARYDERIRAVILNGSRANPHAPRDLFQDFDIVYAVTEVASFVENPQWLERFGELMILQTPDAMGAAPPRDSFAYLMQFIDGNRIDLTLHPVAKLETLRADSLSVLLLDKDGILAPFPPPNESAYFPKPPTAKEFADCCNEFWWMSVYVAKGLWRAQMVYAKYTLDTIVRAELAKMLTWRIGVRTQFSKNVGAFGKYFQNYLDAREWELLLQTYADADYENTWRALFAMGELFRQSARAVAAQFDFEYPQRDDERVSAHLERVRRLPHTAQEL